MEAQLQASIENLNQMFLNKMSQFEAQLKNKTTSNTSDISVEFTAFRTLVTDTLKCLQQQVELLAHSVDRLETQSRRKMLLLHGVAEARVEDVAQVVTGIMKDRLQLDGFDINNIKRCHRLGKPSAPHRHRPIIIKFHQISVRDKAWFTMTKLKGSGITLSEFLSKPRHDIFMAAREKLGMTRCWTKEGNVYVLGPDGERHQIVAMGDLHKIVSLISQDTKVDKVGGQSSKIEGRSKRNPTKK